MSTPPSPTNALGDSMLCPVCYLTFDGRIIQCCQGHSVCEKCHRQLNNECPQCRSSFTGTRNYQLEDIIKQLQMLKQLACASSSTSDAENGNGSGAEIKVLEKFFKSIPKPNDTELPSARLGSSAETVDNITVTWPQLIELETSNLGRSSPGLFDCRMMNCTQKLPVCRLLNHIRCFHKEELMESRLPVANPEFNMRWTFPCASYRTAIQISKFGLFFFIVNVTKESSTYTANAWVQRVCQNNEARKFTFQIEMRMGNRIGCFTDYVYGASSGAAYIEEKNQCLHMEYNMQRRNNRNLKQIAADVKIVKTARPTNMRRTNVTNITSVETQSNQ